MFQVALLHQEVCDRAILGPRFHVWPLLVESVCERNFFPLALSQKNTRLLRCTWHSSEEVPLPSEVKTNVGEWMNQVRTQSIGK